jgi:uncharacterized repeat protein (TIGR02543 family)
MKNWKQLNVMAVIAIVGIIIGFVACDNNSGNNDPETFTVTFHANGGSPIPPNQTIEKGKTATEPATMTKTNCDFDGWYKESGFTTKWNFATNTVTANIDLYAQWTYGVLPNTTIKIYKGNASITDVQMATAVTKITTVYTNNIVATGMVDDFQGYVSFIHVVPGTETVRKGNVVEVGFDATEMDIGTQFLMIGMGMD